MCLGVKVEVTELSHGEVNAVERSFIIQSSQEEEAWHTQMQGYIRGKGGGGGGLARRQKGDEGRVWPRAFSVISRGLNGWGKIGKPEKV